MKTHKPHRHERHHSSFADEQFARAVCSIKDALAMYTADTAPEYQRRVVTTAVEEFLDDSASREA
jgi:hypothetical protein